MAKTELFSVKDVKSGTFESPFRSTNSVTAIRSFAHNVNNPELLIKEYPEDFDLYKIGEFDPDTGILTPIGPNRLIGAIDLLKKD